MEKRPHLIPTIISAVLLLGALGDWPYEYYQFLRFVVCGTAAYTAYLSYDWKKIWAAWIFAFIALLFNPLAPIYLSRELWQPIDIICAIVFAVIAAFLRKPQKPNICEAKG